MIGDVGCLGSATVSRASILAYFMDPEEIDVNGRMYPVEGYHEHECIIDPSAIKRINYERVEGPSRGSRRIAVR